MVHDSKIATVLSTYIIDGLWHSSAKEVYWMIKKRRTSCGNIS